LLPVWNPLPRQAAAAAAWQSGAPFCAAAQRSRTVTMRAFGNPMTASEASLATSRVSLANWSNVACVPCKSVLNLVVPSLSQWPMVSTKPGWKTESGAGAAEGFGGGLGRLLTRNIAGGTEVLCGCGRGQAKRAHGHDRARDCRERASLKYFRMAGHPDPVDVTAGPSLGGTRGKNEERRNFRTDRGRR